MIPRAPAPPTDDQMWQNVANVVNNGHQLQGEALKKWNKCEKQRARRQKKRLEHAANINVGQQNATVQRGNHVPRPPRGQFRTRYARDDGPARGNFRGRARGTIDNYHGTSRAGRFRGGYSRSDQTAGNDSENVTADTQNHDLRNNLTAARAGHTPAAGRRNVRQRISFTRTEPDTVNGQNQDSQGNYSESRAGDNAKRQRILPPGDSPVRHTTAIKVNDTNNVSPGPKVHPVSNKRQKFANFDVESEDDSDLDQNFDKVDNMLGYEVSTCVKINSDLNSVFVPGLKNCTNLSDNTERINYCAIELFNVFLYILQLSILLQLTQCSRTMRMMATSTEWITSSELMNMKLHGHNFNCDKAARNDIFVFKPP